MAYTVSISQAVMDSAGAKPKRVGEVIRPAATVSKCSTQAARMARRVGPSARRRAPSAGTR